MALNLVSRVQVTASRFINKRNATALSHHGVRLEYDPEARRVAALTLGVTLAFVAAGVMFLLSWFKPAGQVGQSKILADRDTGAIYVMVDGRLHPALNLMSARLIAGEPANPTFVKASELSKYPQGPTVGVPGAPTSMPLRTGEQSRWAVCDTAPTATAMASAGDRSVVTAIAGPLSLGERSTPLGMPAAVLARHTDKTYIIWDGHRSEIDLRNKAVTQALGLDPNAPAPVPMSKALFDAIPATDPLVVPAVPDGGQPSPWNLGPGVKIGSVLAVADLTEPGTDTFFVLLPTGVQEISPFVATLMRSANSFGEAAPVAVSPDVLAPIPRVTTLPVSYYPPTQLELVDPTVNTTTCLAWDKAATDRAAEVQVLSGPGLPIPPDRDSHLVRLVKDGAAGSTSEADQVYIGPEAANLVMTTGAAPTAATRESLWWISDQGVRFGVELEQKTLEALGISPEASAQAPWPLIAVYSPGPALTRADALTQHDSLGPVSGAEPLPPPGPGR